MGERGEGVRGALLSVALPFGGILLLAVIVFGLVGWLETPGGQGGLLAALARLDDAAAMDRVANSAEVVAGVLAVAITVVAIVVELAANRYTHRITHLFVREPVNALVLGLFVLTTILVVWISARPPPPSADGLLPRAGLLISLGLVTTCLLLLIPYFAYVFRFLAPANVVRRLGARALRPVRRARARGDAAGRERVIEAIEEITDVARGSRSHGERHVAVRAIDALAELLREYATLREGLPPAWFAIDGPLGRDPDFVSLDPDALADVERERLWLEYKVMRRYMALFAENLGEARDAASLICLDTRRLAEARLRDGPAFVGLCVRTFNSYLRAAINAGDLRTAYFVLHQQRLLAEAALEVGRDDLAVEIADHLRSYGQMAFERGQAFLLETAAYDLAVLVERAVELGSPGQDALLGRALEVDRDDEVRGPDEERLRGVRRAQVRLATFFLMRGDEDRARRIQQDMADERPERLAAIHEELRREDRSRYWEITDRGVNFSYLPPERRSQLDRFFAWFEEAPAAGAAGQGSG